MLKSTVYQLLQKSPLSGLIPDILSNARSVPRFNHTFINGKILFGLIQAKAPGFEIGDERIYFPQPIPGSSIFGSTTCKKAMRALNLSLDIMARDHNP
jgi:hypothetical protein